MNGEKNDGIYSRFNLSEESVKKPEDMSFQIIQSMKQQKANLKIIILRIKPKKCIGDHQVDQCSHYGSLRRRRQNERCRKLFKQMVENIPNMRKKWALNYKKSN